MRVAAVREKSAPFHIEERETPEPEPGQVRVAVEACGVCHSDAFTKEGGFPGLEFPRVPGHEVAGRIDAVGDDVARWKVGDRVGVGWHGGHCFVCGRCRRGDFINCENGRVTGIHHDGGYATHMIAPAESVARIPESMDAVLAGPLLCAGVTTFNALRNAGLRAGATVAVQGIGGLGHLGLQFARQMGFHTVALSRGTDKKELAEELGAHDYVDTEAEDVADALQKLGGADLVLATAPHPKAIQKTFGGLAARGKLLLVAATGETLELPGFPFLTGKSVAGWPSGSSIDSEDTMTFATRHGVAPRTETFALDQADEAYAKMMEGEVRFRAVLTMG